MTSNSFFQKLNHIPSSIYLWMALILGAASSSVTRKIIEIGENHLIDGRNPISLCNVLFVGNICALAVMLLIFYPQLNPTRLKQFTRKDWISLAVVAILSGAIEPALIFAALDNTNVTNVVLIGRLEPPVTLALSIWLLKSPVDIWTISGSIISFVGVAITALLASSQSNITMMGGLIHLGKGELQVAIASILLALATILSKSKLHQVPVGFFSLFRTTIGTIIFFVLAYYLYGSQHFADAFFPFLWGWMLLYGAVIVAAGQLFSFAGLKNASVAEITLTNSVQPLAAIAFAYLILQEIPTSPQYWGGFVILIGIVLGAIGNLRQAHCSRMTPDRYMEATTGFRGI